MLRIFLTLFLVSLCASQTIVPVTDPNWYWTEYNWAKNSTGAHTANPGAYFKVGFTGTSVALNVDETQSPNSAFMNIWWSVDDGKFTQITLPTQTVATLPLAKGLASGNHLLEVYVYNSQQGDDRWNGPACLFQVTGLVLDSGAQTLKPTLRSKRLLAYGDSITEGVQALCAGGGDLGTNAALNTWAFSLAATLDAELSVVGFGRLGWTISGNGGVPPVFTPGNDAQSSWNKIDSKNARSFSPNPDYIVIAHGANDGLNGKSDADVSASVTGWLVATRAAAPSSRIILAIPFGQFCVNAITTGLNNYKSQHPNDNNVFLINLGAAGARGLTAFNGGTQEACDGIHPLTVRDGQLGAMYAAAILKL
jgi:lysophospholipase L1-like esterase